MAKENSNFSFSGGSGHDDPDHFDPVTTNIETMPYSCTNSEDENDVRILVKNSMHTSPVDGHLDIGGISMHMKPVEQKNEKGSKFSNPSKDKTNVLKRVEMLQHYEDCIDAVATAMVCSVEEIIVNSNEDDVAVPIPNEAFPPQEQAQWDENLDSGETTPFHKTALITKPCHVKKKSFLSVHQEPKLLPRKLEFKKSSVSKNGAGTSAHGEDEPSTFSELQPSSQGLLSSQQTSQKDPRLQLLRLQRLRSETGTWVQCSLCEKWRYLADILDPQQVNFKWNCSMNKDEAFSSCLVAQVGPTPQEEEDMVHSQYAAGSLVWAHLSGFPWWPAMVDDDPDFEQFYWLNDFSDIPTYYNVVFFDGESVTRAWVTPNAMLPFTGLEKDKRLSKTCAQGVNFHRRLETARLDATKAAQLSVARRLQEFSFVARYKGKIGKVASSKSQAEGKKPSSRKKSSSSNKTLSTSDSSISNDSLSSDEEPVKKKLKKLQQASDYKIPAVQQGRMLNAETSEKAKKYCSSPDTDSNSSQQAKVVIKTATKRTKQDTPKVRVPCKKTKANKEKVALKQQSFKKPNFMVKKSANKAMCIPLNIGASKGGVTTHTENSVEPDSTEKVSKFCNDKKSANDEQSEVKEATLEKKESSYEVKVSSKKNKVSKFNAPIQGTNSKAKQEQNSVSTSKDKLVCKKKQNNLGNKPCDSPSHHAEKIDTKTEPEEASDSSVNLKQKKRKLAPFSAPKLKQVDTDTDPSSQVKSCADDISSKEESSAGTELNTDKNGDSKQNIDSMQVLCGSEVLSQELHLPQQLENLSQQSVSEDGVPSPPPCGRVVIEEDLTQVSSVNLDFFRCSSPLFEMEE